MAQTLSDAFDFWGGHYNKVVNGLAATVGVDAHASGLTSKPLRQRPRGPPTGLEFASCLTTDGGLVMVQDLPSTQRHDGSAEKNRWGKHHDKVVVLVNGQLSAKIGWELYQSSVQIEVKDVSEDPGWQLALQRNREAGGTLSLPIFMQGDRIYWGKDDDEELHEMCRMFRQNQSARLDKPPDILRQTFNKETYNVSEADAFKGNTMGKLSSDLGYIWDGGAGKDKP